MKPIKLTRSHAALHKTEVAYRGPLSEAPEDIKGDIEATISEMIAAGYITRYEDGMGGVILDITPKGRAWQARQQRERQS